MWIKTVFIAAIFSVAASFNAFGQDLLYHKLSEYPNQTVLNARLGSRHSFSFVGKEKGYHIGLLGMDNDLYRQVLFQVSADGDSAYFDGATLNNGTKKLDNQQFRIGLTDFELKGSLGSQKLEVSTAIISPYTVADSINDVQGIHIQTLPVYLVKFTVKNTGNSNLKRVGLKFGLNQTPYDRDKEVGFSWWRRGKSTMNLFFKDIAGEGGLTSIGSFENDAAHFDTESFNGLTKSVSLAAGESKEVYFYFSGYYGGRVMKDLRLNQDLKFYYTTKFNNIDEVNAWITKNKETLINKTSSFEKFFIQSKATPQEKWVTALAFHTDLANSLLVSDKDGNPYFYLTEGRFRHMNTIDVAIETELQAVFAPWRLKMQLEQWSNYLATKDVMVPSGRSMKGIKMNIEGVSASEFGPYLFHDVGNFPYVFAAEGYDFGPVMPIEENCNFTMLLYWYYKLTSDKAFVNRHLGLVNVLMQSMKNRDSNVNGVADYAFGWSTYDVSEALKRSPENLYLGVKEAVSYLMTAELNRNIIHKSTKPKNSALKTTDEDGTTLDGNGKSMFEKSIMDNTYLRIKQASEWESEAKIILQTLQKAKKKYGFIPLSLDESFEGWNQSSVVLTDGLFLSALSGLNHPTYDAMVTTLQPEWEKAMQKSKTPHGIKLSSGEDVTWFSKIMAGDIVAKYKFKYSGSNASYTYTWNLNNHQAYQDGAFSLVREWPGNWYPRGISALGYLLYDAKFEATQRHKIVENLK